MSQLCPGEPREGPVASKLQVEVHDAEPKAPETKAAMAVPAVPAMPKPPTVSCREVHFHWNSTKVACGSRAKVHFGQVFCNLNIAIQQQRQCSSAQVDVADVPADLPVEPRSTPLAKQVWCSDLALSMVCRVLKQPLDMVVGNFGMARDCWGCRGCSFCGIFEGSPWRCHRPHRLPFQPLQRSGQWAKASRTASTGAGANISIGGVGCVSGVIDSTGSTRATGATTQHDTFASTCQGTFGEGCTTTTFTGNPAVLNLG